MHKKNNKKKKEENIPFGPIKRSIIILTAIFFVILIFLLLLPKKPDIIKGVTYDLKYPDVSHYSQIPGDIFEKDFKLMKEAGINTIRLYGVPPEFILDLADKYKIKVIETIVFPGDWTDFDSPYQLQALKREAIRNINRDINRECIYAWSIWNDAPWTYGSGRGDAIRAYGKEKVSNFLRELYETVKKRDPLRPVTAATLTVNDEAKNLGADFLDILGYNIYLGIIDWRVGSYDSKISEKMVDDLVSISKKYKKPVLIAETGCSTYWKSVPQEDIIRDQIEKVGRRVGGVILFQWADDWSKSGDVTVHNDDVEEHWGLVDGKRELKGGYHAAKKMFRNTALKNLMFGISDYFRGSYFAARKRALRRVWKENVIADKEIDRLQNQLSLKPASEDVPAILDELSKKLFKKKGFDQFASFLKEYASSNENSAYRGLFDYYIALAGWSKLEYLAGERMWELYYAEKNRHMDNILRQLEIAKEKAKGKESYLKILYLEWLIQNDLLEGKENIALERLQKEIKSYSAENKDVTPLMTYSKLLREEGEIQISEKLLRDYVSNIGKFMGADEAVSLLKTKAEFSMNNRDIERAKILYGAHLNLLIKNVSEEDASFAILELASLYRRKSLFDESIEVCKVLLSEFPNSELADDAAYAIGMALKEQKSYSKAIQAFRSFIISYPESNLSKSAIKEILSIFTIYGKGVRAEKTVSFLKEIIALYPDSDFSIMARFELAFSLASLKKREEAVHEYQYIIDNHPDSEYANYSRMHIERLRKGE